MGRKRRFLMREGKDKGLRGAFQKNWKGPRINMAREGA